MDCCESPRSPATSRRALLLGGASFAAWAYLPKFARAADGRDPRLIVVILRGALDGLATVAPIRRSRLCRPARFDRADAGRPACGCDARFLLRPASGDAGIRPDVQRAARRRGPRGVDAVSRPLAFRRAGRARKRFCRAGPGAVRLAQPRAGSVAERRTRDERSCRRPDHAAGAARCGADRRLGAGGAAASRRRYRDAPPRTLPSSRSRAGVGVVARVATRQGRAGRRYASRSRAPTMRARCGWWRAVPPS